jgi:hypothetical protein
MTTSTWEIKRKGKAARISFVAHEIFVVIEDVQVTIANPPKRGSGRHRYWPCEAHCVRLFDRAVEKIAAWKLEREAKELASMKEHAYA